MTSHLRRTYRLPPHLADRFVAALWLAGTSGIEEEGGEGGQLLLHAYFTAESPPLDALEAEWGPRGVERTATGAVAEQDWMAAYRARAQPFPVGERLWVDPREAEEGSGGGSAPPAGRVPLHLPARRAFGVGSHESTRLALELLERRPTAGRVLDVGTGTGILAFAALAFGAESATAFDADPEAAFAARDNARGNGFAPRLFAGTAAALAPGWAPGRVPGRRFELILVNVIPEEILGDLPFLAGLLAAGGELIFSGILAERGGEVAAGLAGLGLVETDRARAGEWVALRFAAGGPA